ncbi:30S ribosomal protein S20 [candidate division WOR-3 bacterium]|nr:30S ribosomal protein S20 [candidate division WOR-3 bacterium]
MPRHASQKKRIRQNEKSNLRNRAMKSQVKTVSKKIKTSKEIKEKEANLSKAYSLIDKSAKKNVYHKNKAARLKSKMAKAAKISKTDS